MAWDPFTRSATMLALPLAIVVTACSGDDGARGEADANNSDLIADLVWDASSSEGGETVGPLPCLTDTPCVDASDCEAGHRCNHTISPPSCQRLYCGLEGEACDPAHGDALCVEGLHCIDGDAPSCAAACQPACDDKECGPDGCEGSCGLHDGACARAEDVCLADGSCCTPACDGLDCGDDGCGGSCGDCEAPELACEVASCEDGQCVHAAAEDGSACLDDGVCDAGNCATADGGMILVPAGAFWMGCNESDAASPAHDEECHDVERPQHEVTTSAYAIDRHEVSVTDWLACVQANACEEILDVHCLWGKTAYGKAGQEEHPINCVNWQQASDYCEWRDPGGRLCSEAEWEKAARGGCETLEGEDCRTASRLYPWGNGDPLSASTAAGALLGNFSDEAAGEEDPGKDIIEGYDDGFAYTAPVGTFPAGTSPYGVLDMAGNVWEWVQDHPPYDYEGAPTDGSAWESVEASDPIYRGGAYFNLARYQRASARLASDPKFTSQFLGLRCCRSL